MKKSLIALAVAGVVAAPAFAATSNVDVYGVMRVSIDHQETNAANSSSWQLNDQTSRIGFKGTEDLGGGLKALWQIEQGISAAAPNNNFGGGTLGMRNTFVGLSGGFGTVVAGRHDTPYKLGGSADLFGDTTADAQCSAGLGQCIIGRNGFDTRAANAIAYISPDFSGFHGAIAIVPGETAGANSPDGLMDAISMVGVYKNGPLNASLAYENYDKTIGAGVENKDAMKLNVGYKIGDIGLGYTFESSDPGYAAGQNKDKGHLLSVSYGMGPITLLGEYGMFDNKNVANADFDRWTIGAAYGLSKRTSVYAAYHASDLETGAGTSTELTVWTFGVNTSF